jgi:hypothetical protein
VAKYLHIDLERWRRCSTLHDVELDYSVFALRRSRFGSQSASLAEIRKAKIPVDMEMRSIGTPSSTDFRSERAITIAFPTDAMLSRLEILFRYSMNRPWRIHGDEDSSFPWQI